MQQTFRRDTLSDRILEQIDTLDQKTMIVKAVPSAAAISYSGEVPYWLIGLHDLPTADRADAAASATLVAELNCARLKVSRRLKPMPFTRRNIGADEVLFVHRGGAHVETELGDFDAPTGRFIFIGRGVGYRVAPKGSDFIALYFESDDPLSLHKSVRLAELAVKQPTPPSERKVDAAVREWAEQIVTPDWTATLVRDFDPLGTAEVIGETNFVHAIDVDEIPAHSPVAPMPGLPFILYELPSLEWAISKRVEPLPFYHRNTNRNELEFVHTGVGDQDTELGYLKAPTGSLYNLPRGIGHTPCNRSLPMVAHIWENGRVQVNKTLLG